MADVFEQIYSDINSLDKKVNRNRKNLIEWVYPTLINGWDNYEENNPVRYCRNNQGFVIIEGAIKNGVIPTVSFVLNEEYRPINDKYFASASLSNSYCLVLPGGEMIISQGNNAFISLSGIIFYAEQ